MKTIIKQCDLKDGPYPASDKQYPMFHGRIPKILNQVAPDEFLIEHFYFFGCPGDLDHAVRMKAGQGLYAEIKKIKEKDKDVKITLVGHSHGGTIALLTVLEAKNQNDHTYVIDKVVLFAMPVQAATQRLAHDTAIFKQVFVNYSNGDWVQCCDPQGLYNYSSPGTPLLFDNSIYAYYL